MRPDGLNEAISAPPAASFCLLEACRIPSRIGILARIPEQFAS
ncbi:MAG: hypothetical protein AAEJ46_11090 [Planctomycetota bacterium]